MVAATAARPVVWLGFDVKISCSFNPACVCVCVLLCVGPWRPGGVGGDYHHGTHRPTGQHDISQQKHHSQRKGGPVGEWAKECVRVQYQQTVNVPFIAPLASLKPI